MNKEIEAVINDSGRHPGVLDVGRLASAVNAPIESACVVEAFHGLLAASADSFY